jgi:hypothetical protein
VNRFTHRKINFGIGPIRGDHAGFGPRKRGFATPSIDRRFKKTGAQTGIALMSYQSYIRNFLCEF